MHPAFSVIFFTVTSGAGYGLFILLVLLDLSGIGPAMDSTHFLLYGALALVLITAGLISSSFHLANVKNAWRALMRFRSSWLSREGILAIVFYPFAMLYLAGIYLYPGNTPLLLDLAGGIAAVLALATVFATGMIYACLKTIRQWRTALTPLNYILYGLMLGGVLLAVMHTALVEANPVINGLALALLTLTALAKGIFYFWIARITGPTLNTATGFTRAPMQLFDTGHTAATFLTREFGYQPSPVQLNGLKILVFVVGFILPALILAFFTEAGIIWVSLAVIAAFVGGVVERWLFFAQARHAVMLYHGLQHT